MSKWRVANTLNANRCLLAHWAYWIAIIPFNRRQSSKILNRFKLKYETELATHTNLYAQHMFITPSRIGWRENRIASDDPQKNPKFEFPQTAICCTNCSSMHTTSNGIATSDAATTTTLYLFFDCFSVSNHSLNYYTSNNSPIELYAPTSPLPPSHFSIFNISLRSSLCIMFQPMLLLCKLIGLLFCLPRLNEIQWMNEHTHTHTQPHRRALWVFG